jgi:serine/threonine protein kinase
LCGESPDFVESTASSIDTIWHYIGRRNCDVVITSVARLQEDSDQQASSSLSDVANEPREIGRYIILKKLGEGGMGSVYAAFDPHLDRRLALKVIRFNTNDGQVETHVPLELRDALLHEARTLASISHPNVVPVYAVGEFDSSLFMSMELVDGASLRQWIAARPGLSWAKRLDLLLAIAEGIDTVHAHGLIHRDIKPDNIMIDRLGRPILVDFGIAMSERTLGQIVPLGRRPDVGVAGTLPYMAPEQLRGELGDRKSDLYAFCVSAVEVLVGTRPFSGAHVDDYLRQMAEGIPHWQSRQVPTWLVREINRGLDSDPSLRANSLREWIVAVKRARHRSQRRRISGLAAIVCTIAFSSIRPSLSDVAPHHPHPLTTMAEALAEPDQLERAHAGFSNSGMQDAGEVWPAIATTWSDRLRDLNEQSEGLEQENSPTTAAVEACLYERAAELATLLDTLALATPQIAAQALGALQSLERPAHCRVPSKRPNIPQPDDPQKRRSVAALRLELQRIRLLIATGDLSDAQRRAQEVVLRAREVEYFPLLAEVTNELATIAFHRLQGAKASDLFRRADLFAVAGKHPHLASLSSSFLPYTQAYLEQQFDAFESLLRSTEAALTRAGFPPGATAEWQRARGLRGFLGMSPESCVHGLSAALAEEERNPDVDLAMLVARRSDLGLCEVVAGALRDGLRHLEAAVNFGEQVLGRNHPALFLPLHNLAVVAESRGFYQDSRRWQQRAAIASSGFSADDSRLVVHCFQDCLLHFRSSHARTLFEGSRACIDRAIMSRFSEHALSLPVRQLFAISLELLGRPVEAKRALEQTIRAFSEADPIVLNEGQIAYALEEALKLARRIHDPTAVAAIEHLIDQSYSSPETRAFMRQDLLHDNPQQILRDEQEREALIRSEYEFPFNSFALAASSCAQGIAWTRLGQYLNANRFFEACVAQTEAELGPTSPALAQPLLNWAVVTEDALEQLQRLRRAMKLSKPAGLMPNAWSTPIASILSRLEAKGIAVDDELIAWSNAIKAIDEEARRQ